MNLETYILRDETEAPDCPCPLSAGRQAAEPATEIRVSVPAAERLKPPDLNSHRLPALLILI